MNAPQPNYPGLLYIIIQERRHQDKSEWGGGENEHDHLGGFGGIPPPPRKILKTFPLLKCSQFEISLCGIAVAL